MPLSSMEPPCCCYISKALRSPNSSLLKIFDINVTMTANGYLSGVFRLRRLRKWLLKIFVWQVHIALFEYFLFFPFVYQLKKCNSKMICTFCTEQWIKKLQNEDLEIFVLIRRHPIISGSRLFLFSFSWNFRYSCWETGRRWRRNSPGKWSF